MSIFRYIILLAVTLFAASGLAAPPPPGRALPVLNVPVTAPVNIPSYYWAAAEGDLDELQRVLFSRASFDVNRLRPDPVWREPLLHWATRGGAAAVRMVIAAGADLNAVADGIRGTGGTALVAAVRAGDVHYHALLALLAAGADPDVTHEPFSSPVYPLGEAVRMQISGAEIGVSDPMVAIRLLLRFGADVNVGGGAVLHQAVEGSWGDGFSELARSRLLNHADMNATGGSTYSLSEEHTPLVTFFSPFSARDPRVLEWLLQNGADVNIMIPVFGGLEDPREAMSPLDLAVSYGLTEVAAVLRTHIEANPAP